MSIKKKLGMGVMSAALGLSLVGGGTWAAFNDTATINNHFAAGILDLEVGKNHPSHHLNFDLSNMKPGDSVQRIFKLSNKGTLAIKEVLLDVTSGNFQQGKGTNDDELAFLSQFEIKFMNTDGESSKWEPRENVFNGTVTLADLVDGSYVGNVKPQFLATDGSNRINLAALTVVDQDYRGIPVTPPDSDAVFIEILFKDDQTRVGGDYSEFAQNIFMDNSVDFFFNLEATQWDGMHVDTPHGNGAMNNGVQGSADGSSTPTNRTIAPGKYDGNEIVD